MQMFSCSEPVIGDPYGLYPEPQREPDILNDEDLDVVFSAGANDSDQSSEEEVHQRPMKKRVSWKEEEGGGDKPDDSDWYWPQPFLYNGRILLVGLPGFLLAFSVGGDM